MHTPGLVQNQPDLRERPSPRRLLGTPRGLEPNAALILDALHYGRYVKGSIPSRN